MGRVQQGVGQREAGDQANRVESVDESDASPNAG